jgi:hypothetical protein
VLNRHWSVKQDAHTRKDSARQVHTVWATNAIV